jgi:hypothetical protein
MRVPAIETSAQTLQKHYLQDFLGLSHQCHPRVNNLPKQLRPVFYHKEESIVKNFVL